MPPLLHCAKISDNFTGLITDNTDMKNALLTLFLALLVLGSLSCSQGSSDNTSIVSSNLAGVSAGNPNDKKIPSQLMASVDDNIPSVFSIMDGLTNPDHLSKKVSQNLSAATKAIPLSEKLLKELYQTDKQLIAALNESGATTLDEPITLDVELLLCNHAGQWEVNVYPSATNTNYTQFDFVHRSKSMNDMQVASYAVSFDSQNNPVKGVFTCVNGTALIDKDLENDSNRPIPSYHAFAYDFSDSSDKLMVFRGTLFQKTIFTSHAYNLYMKCQNTIQSCSMNNFNILTPAPERTLAEKNSQIVWNYATGEACVEVISFATGERTTTDSISYPESGPCTLNTFSAIDESVVVTEDMLPIRIRDTTPPGGTPQAIMNNWELVTPNLNHSWLYDYIY